MIYVHTIISNPIESRQEHLALNEKCLERGGNSTNHKGILAQFLDTDIPSGRILLCHACHNGHCSNPRHLYWGTDKDNFMDALSNGRSKSFWEASVRKYGYEEARKMCARGNKSNGGKAGKGKKLSDTTKRKISNSLKGNKNAVRPTTPTVERNDLKSLQS